MSRLPNRESDLTPAGERKRKSRGTKVTKVKAGDGLTIEPDPNWHANARLIWDSAQASGGKEFYEASDLAVLHLTCEGFDHWLTQGGRRSPELLRVLMQNLSGLLFTEGDRRRLNIELQKPNEEDHDFLAAVTDLFQEETTE